MIGAGKESNTPGAFVLGHTGMLGHTVARFLEEKGVRVYTTSVRFEGPAADALIDEVCQAPCSAVINCIGRTPGRARDGAELFATNALLPQRLAAALAGARLLVHPSSDGVFDGRKGSYSVDERPNALDPYGLSKRLGELSATFDRVVILRCSVLGLDRGAPRSLLSWFLAQRTPVTGFTNHLWNGVTALEWAKVAYRAIAGDPDIAAGIHQPACASPVSKFDLLSSAAKVFEHHVPLTRGQSETAVDRTLIGSITCPPIDEQLRELRAWSSQRNAAEGV